MLVRWLLVGLGRWPFAHLLLRPKFVLVVSSVLSLSFDVPDWMASDLDLDVEGAAECLLLADHLTQAEQHFELVEQVVQSCLELLHQHP